MKTPPTQVRSRRRAPLARTTRRWSSDRLDSGVASFLRSLRARRPETRGTYERALHEFLRWSRRRDGLGLTVGEIRAYKRHLTQRRGLSDVSVSTYLTAVRRFCGYLQRTGALAENPALRVSGNPRPRTHARTPLSLVDATILLESLRGEDERGLRDAAVIRLMLRCAMSDAEIVRLNLCDLSRTGGSWVLAVQGKGRSSKDATVELPDDVSGAINAYLRRRAGSKGNEPLFLSAGNSSRGRRLTTRAVRDRVNDYLEQARIRTARTKQRVTPRSLRYTAALLMAAEGASAGDIRRRLRLGTAQTVQVYLQASRGRGSRRTGSRRRAAPSGNQPGTTPAHQTSHRPPSHHQSSGDRPGN